MRENAIEAYLCHKVKKLGGKCLKFLSTIDGVPDRLVLLPNRVPFMVETKSTIGKLSKIQKHVHKELKGLITVFVVKSYQDIDKII